MQIILNHLETARFGIAFARLEQPGADSEALAALLERADRDGVDVISSRVPCGDLATIHVLEAAGFRLMDTLTYWRIDLLAALPAEVPSPFSITDASPADAEACAAVAAAAFQDYLGHYHSDRRLDRDAADQAYVDWTQRLLTEPADGQLALVARAGNDCVGYLVGLQTASGSSEILLNAVDPAFQRQGAYTALLAAYLGRMQERGCSETSISTQLHNFRVQRVWRRLGFAPCAGFHTFHRWSVKEKGA